MKGVQGDRWTVRKCDRVFSLRGSNDTPTWNLLHTQCGASGRAEEVGEVVRLNFSYLFCIHLFFLKKVEKRREKTGKTRSVS